MLKTDNYRLMLQQASLKLTKRWLLLIVIIIGLCAAVFVVFGNPAAACICLIICGASIYLPLVRRNVRGLWAVGIAMRVLARDNNMRYIEIARPNYKKHFLPAVARLGLWERKEQIVTGHYDGFPFETYVHTYRHLWSSRYNRVAIRVYCITLPKELPHIYLRNQQAGQKLYSILQRHFDDDQRVDLEGNFNQVYTVYTHRRTVTQALSLLAPNVMETLVNSNAQFDVEFVGSKMYLYSRDYYTNADELAASMQTIDAILKHLKHRLKGWKFTLPNNQHFPYLVSRPGFGTVAFGHRYYNRSWLFIAAYNFYSIARSFISLHDLRIPALIVVGVSDVVMISVLLVFRRRYQLLRRNVAR